MRIAPVSLDGIKLLNTSFEGRKSTRFFDTADISKDTFCAREDGYTRRYKELLNNAHNATYKIGSKKPCLNSGDIAFLLEIKDDEKFRSLVTTPVPVLLHGKSTDTNIFFYTDANATRKLVRRLDDRGALKKLLSQKHDGRTVFFAIAQNDDIKKAKALQEGLSAKEFKRFMSARDVLYGTPYSVAQEKNGALKAMLDPIFADET